MASKKKTAAKGKTKEPVNTVPTLPAGHYEAGELIAEGDRLYVSPDDGKLYTDGSEVDFLGMSLCNCLAGIVLKLDEGDFAANVPADMRDALSPDHEIVDAEPETPRTLFLWWPTTSDVDIVPLARWDNPPADETDGGSFADIGTVDDEDAASALVWDETPYYPTARGVLVNDNGRATLAANGMLDAIRAANEYERKNAPPTIEQTTADAAWQRAETVDGDGQIPLIPHDETLIRTSYPVEVMIENSRTAQLVHRAIAERAGAIAKLAATTRKEGYPRLAEQVKNDAAILLEDVLPQIEVEQELALPRFGSLAHGCANAVLATLCEFIVGTDARATCAQKVGDIMASFGRDVAEKAHARGLAERQYTSEGICLEALGGALVRDVNEP